MFKVLSKMLPSTALGRMLRFPLRFLPKKMVIFILSGELRGKKWIVGAGNHGYWVGSYEYEKQKIFSSFLREGAVIYDVGANVGFYTLISSSRTGAAGKVFAFEPSSVNCSYLKRHLSLNSVENVTLFEAAVADYTGQGFFDKAGNPYEGRLAEDGVAVKVVSLDALLDEGKLLPPDLIKIDVEGAELQVLNGAARLIKRYSPTILLATHNPEVHRGCLDFLSSAGYEMRSISQNDLASTDELVAIRGAGK